MINHIVHHIHDIKGHLDETISALPITILQKIMDKDEKVFEIEVHNPKYITYKKRDQSPITYITATLSKKVLYIISDNLYARELWKILARSYSQVSKARIIQRRHQFHNQHRGSKRIMHYGLFCRNQENL